MRDGRRGGRFSSAITVIALAMVCGVGSGVAEDAARQVTIRPAVLPDIAANGPLDVETVFFADRKRAPVRVVRGPHNAAVKIPPRSTEIVSFGSGFNDSVTVVRGGNEGLPTKAARHPDPMAQARVEKVSFTDPHIAAVTVIRGPTPREPLFMQDIDLFGPADGAELGRIAFAVDGVESRHGSDPRMWRPEPSGPQGPMQVSAAAAFDVGGGDRFDTEQNRLLGRAYLAQMFRRYGNWIDAVAAYNWGPANVDSWVAGGRNAERLPIGVARYVSRVLHDALVASAGL
ncbi:MAG TPA: lytic transglycosylase domain-containing protein [Stellaceae bacterium]|nr:lytic transglycosylase domain-containing protein [Stellaceae bacterium]